MFSRLSFAHILLVITLMMVLCHPVPSNAKTLEIAMGLVAADSKTLTLERWAPITDLLSKKTGILVKPVVVDDYASVIWLLATNKIQFAWGGNKFAIEAVDRADCEVVAKTIHANSSGGYYSHLIVRKDSPLNSLDDVISHASELTFGNGDPNSTSGFVVPGYYIFAKRNLSPSSLFKRMKHYNHEGNFHAVISREVEVATSNSLALKRYEVHFPAEAKLVKVIWTSPLIPSDPIVMRKDMKPSLQTNIINALTSLGSPTDDKTKSELLLEKALLQHRNWQGFILSDNSQLKPIRKLQLFKKKLSIERDSAILPQQKKILLDAVDKQLEKLDT